ncbi:MAG: HD-GYP domain-containing protein [Nitrospiraceae bacterium]
MPGRLECHSVLSKQMLVIQHMLAKVDGLHLPPSSRFDIESILCRQIVRLMERSMPRYTGHGERTAAHALALGQAISLSQSELHHLKLAALLHDIGLLTLPQRIMSAPDALGASDYALFQSHPRAGARLLEPFRFLRHAAVLIAHHHERWDGRGYPYGIRGEFIPLGARILAVADCFDSLCSRQPSNRSFGQDLVLDLLRVTAGSRLDPCLVTVFVELRSTGRMESTEVHG